MYSENDIERLMGQGGIFVDTYKNKFYEYIKLGYVPEELKSKLHPCVEVPGFISGYNFNSVDDPSNPISLSIGNNDGIKGIVKACTYITIDWKVIIFH